MLATHRHDRLPLGWTSGMNLFSLMFTLLLALAFIVLLMLVFEVMQKERKPAPAPPEPAHHAMTLASVASRFG